MLDSRSAELLEGANRDAAEILEELENSTPERVRSQRAHDRLQIRAKIVARPGNASQRLDLKLQGFTGDVSSGGCQALFPLPLMVGDIYQITFDRSMLDLPPVLARCMRCRLVRDDAFEAGMAFLQPIDLSNVNTGDQG
jgi:hypothetical protein